MTSSALDRPTVQVRPRALNLPQLAETVRAEVVHGAPIARPGRVRAGTVCRSPLTAPSHAPSGSASAAAFGTRSSPSTGQRARVRRVHAPPCRPAAERLGVGAGWHVPIAGGVSVSKSMITVEASSASLSDAPAPTNARRTFIIIIIANLASHRAPHRASVQALAIYDDLEWLLLHPISVTTAQDQSPNNLHRAASGGCRCHVQMLVHLHAAILDNPDASARRDHHASGGAQVRAALRSDSQASSVLVVLPRPPGRHPR